MMSCALNARARKGEMDKKANKFAYIKIIW